MDIMETLRQEIETCGKRRSIISIETHVDQAVLYRIKNGGSCKAETLEKLLDHFGYEIRKKKTTKKSRAKK